MRGAIALCIAVVGLACGGGDEPQCPQDRQWEARLWLRDKGCAIEPAASIREPYEAVQLPMSAPCGRQIVHLPWPSGVDFELRLTYTEMGVGCDTSLVYGAWLDAGPACMLDVTCHALTPPTAEK